MKQQKILLLLIVFSMMALGTLFAFITPDSPDYDSWKQRQIKPVSPYGKSRTVMSNIEAFGSGERDPFNLLIPLDATFTLALDPNDDQYTDEITLPFVFSLYGQPYQSFWINNNGNVTFDEGYYSYTPWGFPIDDSPMLAPFFADVDTRGAGAVWYKMESNRVIVIWDHVGYYGSHADKLNTFELIFTDGTDPTIGIGNTVAFSFADMSWTTGDASDGVDGFGGTAATVGINKGDGVAYDQIGRFDHAGYDYDGPFDNNDGVDWLDGKVFYFGTGGAATLTVVPTDDDFGVEPPAGAIPGDENTQAYYAVYPIEGIMPVSVPAIDPGTYRGWIYYNSAWHEADVFPVEGPNATIVFSAVPFGGRFNVPIFVTREPDDTLPVELSSFTAVQTDLNLAKLTWVSQSETSLLGYRVYRNVANSPESSQLITPVLIGATNTSTTQTYSITDPEVEIGHTYWYWLESVDYSSSQLYGPVSLLLEGDTTPEFPGQTVMRNAYPNPFKAIGGTTIEVDVKENDSGTVAIYNIIGQEMISYPVMPGNNSINWNGKDSRGNSCSTGVYFYKLSTNSSNQTRKLLIVK